MKAIKSLQRFNANSSQNTSNGFLNADIVDDSVLEADDGQVQRLKLTVPTRDWITFLPAEAAEAYVLERSHLPKDRLALEGQEAWAKGLRHFVPRVTKECRLYLKRALAERTGLPCRIGLTGRCHLKPPFSRKKRAPLFVTNGFCGRKDLKCLRFRFTVQDFDPQTPFVTVDVEIRGRLLTGPEGEERHARRPSDDPLSFSGPARGTKRAASAASAGPEARGKKQRRNSKKGAGDTDADADVANAASAYDALQAENWPEEFDLNSAEVILDDGKVGGEFAAADQAVNTIQVMSDVNGAESALGEDAARELVQLANEALSLAGAGTAADGSAQAQLTATKIVQSGDQVFIFVSDPNEPHSDDGATIEAVEVNCDELATENAVAENGAGEVVHSIDGNGSLAEYLLANNVPEAPSQDAPCMEYRWKLKLPMTDWLKLLPAKSLRYYIHERTVGREVWVEEGWERQFRCQTLQSGWRDLIRRGVVEQTDIPCQLCFRGRSSLKLPFSRKHSAALWRTQGYCARGDRSCLLYKFCVQDFHPDDESVTVQVYAVGKLHKDCRRWFKGQGTLVDLESVTKDWPQRDAELEDDAVDRSASLLRVKQEPVEPREEEWGDADADLEQDQEDEEDEVPAEEAKGAAAGEEMYQSVINSLVTFKTSLYAARRCPLKMQAALRLLRNADSMVAGACKTPNCLCRPEPPPPTMPNLNKPRYRWPDKARARKQSQDEDHDDEHDAMDSPSPPPPTPPPARPSPEKQPAPRAAALVPMSPPPLRPCGSPRRPAAPATPAATADKTTPRTTPGSPVKSPDSLWQKVTRTGSVVLTAIKQQPSIIKLSPAQMSANVRRGVIGTPITAASTSPRSSSKLVSLSSAIERSAVLTPSIIKPSATAALATSTPRPTKPPVSQPVVSSSSSQDTESRTARAAAPQHDQGADPSWIVDEMRSVILGGGRDEQKQGATGATLKQTATAAKPATTPAATASNSVAKATVNLAVRAASTLVTKSAAKPAEKPAVKLAEKPVVKLAEKPHVKPVVKSVEKPAEKKMSVVVAKAEATSPVREAVSPSRGVSTRIMVKKVGQKVTSADLPLVERALRALEQPKESATAERVASTVSVSEPVQQSSPRPAKTVFAPSRPVTRGITRGITRAVVGAAVSCEPPPLVPIGLGGPNKVQAAATPGARVSRVSVASTNKSAYTPTPTSASVPTSSSQSTKAPTKTGPTKVPSSVKQALFPKGKVLILKPSMLRSSPRRPL